MSKFLAIGLAAAALIAAPAAATEYVFTTTGSSGVNGTYGNTRNYSATSGGSTINLTASAYQYNQSTGAVSTAFLGAFSHGLGVTGIGDQSGRNNLHQIDNVGGYIDFVLLQFSQAVTLESLGMYSFGLPNMSADHDFATYAVSGGLSGMNSADWLQVMTNGASGNFLTGASGASTSWLVAAGPNSYSNDGFKLNSVTVESAVPEPGTWAMMLLGFGAVGFAARRSRKPALATA